ncbi:MAG: hypothetical protein HQ464_02095, partial [Planctomycetes bacterium]|nr:hypothetical protein [Planctomycetota bacterium]
MFTVSFPTAAPRRLSLAQKLAFAGGAGVAITGIAPQLADAVLIQSTTLPLSPPASSGNNFWDVDGDGTNDFKLRKSSTFASLTELGPARLVAPADVTQDGFAKLNAGFNVGSTLAVGYKFFNNAQKSIQLTHQGAVYVDAQAGGWAQGDIGYFGFKFTKTSGVHYGWGLANMHGATGGFVIGQGYTFTDAYYNSVAGAAIAVGDTGPGAVP